MKEQEHLLKNKKFWPTFWTQFFGAFNDNVFKNALVMLITYKAYKLSGLSPESMVALCGGIFILPFFLFSAMAGQICDKYPKHKLMFYIKVWEIGVMIIGGYGFITENIVVLIGTLFVMGLQSSFFGPVKYSILPELVKDSELVQGNALVSMATFVAILLGTIIGGVLIAIEDGGEYFVAGAVIC
jgi:MFS family permease